MKIYLHYTAVLSLVLAGFSASAPSRQLIVPFVTRNGTNNGTHTLITIPGDVSIDKQWPSSKLYADPGNERLPTLPPGNERMARRGDGETANSNRDQGSQTPMFCYVKTKGVADGNDFLVGEGYWAENVGSSTYSCLVEESEDLEVWSWMFYNENGNPNEGFELFSGKAPKAKKDNIPTNSGRAPSLVAHSTATLDRRDPQSALEELEASWDRPPFPLLGKQYCRAGKVGKEMREGKWAVSHRLVMDNSNAPPATACVTLVFRGEGSYMFELYGDNISPTVGSINWNPEN